MLDRVRDKIRFKYYSIRTEQAYVDWSCRFILFHGKRHPQEMGATEVEAFLTHLAVRDKFKIRPAALCCFYIKKRSTNHGLGWKTWIRPSDRNGCRSC